MPNSNYWIDYDGTRFETTFVHGQRVMALQTAVIAGTEPPTDIDIQLAGDGDAPTLTIHVDHTHTLHVTPVEVYRRDQM